MKTTTRFVLALVLALLLVCLDISSDYSSALAAPGYAPKVPNTGKDTSLPPVAYLPLVSTDIPVAPPTGKIAYTASRYDTASQRFLLADIYVMTGDGKGRTQLTDTPDLNEESPSWSPDGQKIVFSAESVDDTAVYVMNADGSHVTDLAVGECPCAWAPDSRRIAYIHDEGDGVLTPLTAELYAIDVDGTGQQRLTSDALDESSPSWSPDGKRIAFAASTGKYENRKANSYVIDADGTNPTLISEDADSPTWSPDGRYLAYLDGPNSSTYRSVTLATANGFYDATDVSDSILVSNIWWSPDSARLAFSNLHNGYKLTIVGVDGKSSISVRIHGWGSNIAWSPDGNWLAFGDSDRDPGLSGGDAIWIVDFRGGHLTRLTDYSLCGQPAWR